MNIGIRNNPESNDKSLNNTPLSNDEYFRFEKTQEEICSIQKQGDKESIFSQIESYNMIQKFTVGKIEYCSTEGIEYIVQKGDTLTCICKEYHGNSQVAYDLMEMYGISEDLEVGQILLLPNFVGDDTLKEKYRNIPSLNERKEQQEKEKNINILSQYDEYLEITHKLDYHITSFSPLPSGIENTANTRYTLYRNIINDTNLNIKQKDLNLYNNLIDYITGKDTFLDRDEELKIFLLKEKSILLKSLPEVQKNIEGENAYRNLEIARDYFKKRIDAGKKDMLSFLDVPLYNFIEAFEQDYLKSVYLNQKFDVGKINGFLKIYEFIRGDFEYNDVKDYIEMIGGTFNGLRGVSWRTLKLGTDIIKAANKSALYDIQIGEDALIEGMIRYTFSFEKYIDNASLNQLVKGTEGTILMGPALASGMLDGYMDAAATIGMFVMEPEQLIRDMKKIPDLWKQIDIKELYKLYAETFDGKPEELYPTIMYTLAYIYVLMIAMPFTAPNLVSKAGELVGKVIGKVKYRNKIKELNNMKKELGITKEKFEQKIITLENLLGISSQKQSLIDKKSSILEKYRTLIFDFKKNQNSILSHDKKAMKYNLNPKYFKNQKEALKFETQGLILKNKERDINKEVQYINKDIEKIDNTIKLLSHTEHKISKDLGIDSKEIIISYDQKNILLTENFLKFQRKKEDFIKIQNNVAIEIQKIMKNSQENARQIKVLIEAYNSNTDMGTMNKIGIKVKQLNQENTNYSNLMYNLTQKKHKYEDALHSSFINYIKEKIKVEKINIKQIVEEKTKYIKSKEAKIKESSEKLNQHISDFSKTLGVSIEGGLSRVNDARNITSENIDK